MKKTSLSLAAASLLLASTPAFAATYSNCEAETSSTERAACLRLQARSEALKRGSNVRQKVIDTVDLLRQVRINRRANTPVTTNRRSTASNARSLAERRTEALTERQARIEARRARKAAQTKERQSLLQLRVKTQAEASARENVINKDSMRQRAEEMQKNAQLRRQAIRKAQDACVGVTDVSRQTCLLDARKELLK